MASDSEQSSPSIWTSIGMGLLFGLFLAGLIYMVDWKMERVQPFYYYLGFVIILVIFEVIRNLFMRYRREKQSPTN